MKSADGCLVYLSNLLAKVLTSDVHPGLICYSSCDAGLRFLEMIDDRCFNVLLFSLCLKFTLPRSNLVDQDAGLLPVDSTQYAPHARGLIVRHHTLSR
jgi:hypothetical protein